MREQGLLGADTSAQAIRQWLSDHRGPDADAVMDLNPRYVFFRTAPDDGLDPAGAANVPLPAGRAVAVDLSRHGLGEPFWIDASAPTLPGVFPVYRRLVMALDTGGAIKGDVRADLYIGRGDAAGLEAGRIRHTLRMYRLTPVR
jgi:membrane-bound lytic murein transglycosylase A